MYRNVYFSFHPSAKEEAKTKIHLEQCNILQVCLIDNYSSEGKL